jgi:hypothetical protein
MLAIHCDTPTVEVYRTTVPSRLAADVLLQQLHWFFPAVISFDLELRRVLRVETAGDPVPGDFIAGCWAKRLPVLPARLRPPGRWLRTFVSDSDEKRSSKATFFVLRDVCVSGI